MALWLGIRNKTMDRSIEDGKGRGLKAGGDVDERDEKTCTQLNTSRMRFGIPGRSYSVAYEVP